MASFGRSARQVNYFGEIYLFRSIHNEVLPCAAANVRDLLRVTPKRRRKRFTLLELCLQAASPLVFYAAHRRK